MKPDLESDRRDVLVAAQQAQWLVKQVDGTAKASAQLLALARRHALLMRRAIRHALNAEREEQQ